MSVLGREEILKRVIVGELILFNKLKDDVDSIKNNMIKDKEANMAVENIEKILQEYGLLYTAIIRGDSWQQVKERYSKIQNEIKRFIGCYGHILKEVLNKYESNTVRLLRGEDAISSLWILYRTSFIRWVKSSVDSEGIEFLDNLIRDYVEPQLPIYVPEINYPILISDFQLDQLGLANYDLRVGRDGYVTAEKFPKKLDWPYTTLFGVNDSILRIPPGSFGIITTYEYIFVPPDLYGLISLRFSFKIKGLVNVSGFHIDPGYSGNIVFGVYNAGSRDIILKYKDCSFIVAFLEVSYAHKRSLGLYSKNSYDSIPSRFVEQLSGDPVSLRSLNERVNSLEEKVKWRYTVLIGIIGTIIGAIMAHMLQSI